MEATAGWRSCNCMLNRKLCCILEDGRTAAVYWFHRDFADVSLAPAEHMSVSAAHHNFKSVT